MTHVRIPGAAEWYAIPPLYGRRRLFVSVSWLALAFVGAVLPAVRLTWRWWTWLHRPGFPVQPR